MSEFEIRKVDEETNKLINQLGTKVMGYLQNEIPKSGDVIKDFNILMNVINALILNFMLNCIRPEGLHEFIEQLMYHLRRNADQHINEAKGQDASQSKDHNS